MSATLSGSVHTRAFIGAVVLAFMFFSCQIAAVARHRFPAILARILARLAAKSLIGVHRCAARLTDRVAIVAWTITASRAVVHALFVLWLGEMTSAVWAASH
jgi:Fe2+ transport system protein B